MGERGRVLLVRGPSSGGIRRHVDALAAALPGHDWAATTLAVPGDPRAGAAIRRAAAAAPVDVVHAHGLKVGWWAALVAHRVPLVVTVHNVVLDEVAGWRAPLLRPLQGRLAARVDAVIATSPAVAEALRTDVAPVVRPFGPSPAPVHHRQAVRAGWGVAGDAPVVATVGRLHRQKGLDVLLDAVPVLTARVPDAAVVIVGEGPLERHLRRRIAAASDLAGRVHLAGPTTDPGAALMAADVVAVPSLWESGPLVVAEAMELARPVVATPVGFVPELVADEATGRVVPVHDAAALGAAVADLLEAPAAAATLAAAGRAPVHAWQDRAAAVAAVVAVYDQVRRRP